MRPYEFDDLLSVLTLGTLVAPGKCTVQGLEDPENWNVSKAKGSTGASTKLEGKAPREFSTMHELADDGDGVEFYAWDTFRALVDSTTNGAEPKALPIYHPDIARAHITEASKKNVKGPVYDGKGGAVYTIDWIEFRPPKPKPPARARATSAGSSATGADGATRDRYDPNAAAKAELESLLTEAQRPL